MQRIIVHQGLCSGCRACEVACVARHEGCFGTATARIHVTKIEPLGVDQPHVCRLCRRAPCAVACPTGALTNDLDYPADTRMGFARLARPGKCLAVKGQGFKGQARGPEYKGLLRYDEIDRWTPIPVSEHPYDLELCDLCVRQCPIEIRIAQCEAEEKQRTEAKDNKQLARVAQRQGNECPPKHAIQLKPLENRDGVNRMEPVVMEGCVGCGVCEMICPVEGAPAIVIDIDKVTDMA